MSKSKEEINQEKNSFIPAQNIKVKETDTRQTWKRQMDFLLACMAFSIGLGNVWRFPYLCYKNGGGVFLIPYFICVVVGGMPMFFLEVALGQFMRVSGLKAWNICPMLKGIGLATAMIVVYLNIYYIVILCWSFYYMFSSFALELPWERCGHEWNTCSCVDFTHSDNTTTNNVTYQSINGSTIPIVTTLNPCNLENTSNIYLSDPVTEFWERKVLAISDGVHNIGTVKWDLALTLLLSWAVVYLCVCKRLTYTGRLMQVIATSPFILIFALLIRNCMLPGALSGIIYYLRPDISKLLEIQVWVDAGTQIFWSYSIGLGALTALGSYNSFHHNSYRDVIIYSCLNSGTSFISGFIIFSILGHMSFIQSKSIDEVAESGPGLAFIAYPKAVALMPAAPVWSAIFFLMLVFLGLGSQIVGMEGIIAVITDQWPKLFEGRFRREILVAVVSIVKFLIGLSMVSNGGMYVFQIFDYYSGSRIVLLVAFFECIAISWIYGINRFYKHVNVMIGYKISPFMWVAWSILSPMFCVIVFILSSINYTELTYQRPYGKYVYPQWSVVIGWLMAISSAIFIPIIAFAQLCRYGFSKEVFLRLLKPSVPNYLQENVEEKRELNASRI